MSYLKLPKTCSDHAIGIQSVNQALDNNRALYYDQFDPKHSVGIDGNAYGDPFLTPGRHDDVLISRAVADFAIDSTGLTPVLLPLMNGPLIFSTSRVAVGKWKIYVTTPQLVSACATIKGPTASVARDAMCFVGVGSIGVYVTVSTWNVNSGVLADYDFSLALWSREVA